MSCSPHASKGRGGVLVPHSPAENPSLAKGSCGSDSQKNGLGVCTGTRSAAYVGADTALGGPGAGAEINTHFYDPGRAGFHPPVH